MSDGIVAIYKAQQQTIGAGVERSITSLWGQLDPLDVDRSFALIAPQVATTVARGYGASSIAASGYLRAAGAAAGADGMTVVLAGAIGVDKLVTTVRTTGPVVFKQALARGQSYRDAAASSIVRMSASGSRLALQGGRTTVEQSIDSSDVVTGWRREARSGCCYFCAMLASRGAVYKTRSRASDRILGSRRIPGLMGPHRPFHDHCQCEAVPLFEGDIEPPDILDLREWFLRATEGKQGAIAVQAWRREYEAVARAETRRALAAAVPRVVPIAERNLRELAEEVLAALVGEAAAVGDSAGLDAVLAELDLRDAAERAAAAAKAKAEQLAARRAEKRAAKAAAERAAKETEYERLLAAGVEPEEAYAEAFGFDVEQLRRDEVIRSLRANGYTGRSFDALARDAYKDEVARLYLVAEEQTRGAMLNRAGQAAGINPATLFDGTEARARKYASEELLGFWQTHGRLSFAEFEAGLLGGQSTLRSQGYWL